MGNKEMITKKTWKEFRETGLFLFVNQFLHIFGWCLVMEIDEGEIKSVYPAKTKFRGFDVKSVSDAYNNITYHISENIDQLKKDIDA